MNKSWQLSSCAVALASVFLAGCAGESSDRSKAGISADGRCPHSIKVEKCPFCKPELIAAEGMCGEHGVAEALCYQCRPYLKEAFRVQGDWCTEHNAPKSQCASCDPGLLENIQPGVHGGEANHDDHTGHDHE